MKMTKEHQKKIRDAFVVLEENPKFRDALLGSIHLGHSDTRLAWDVFRAAKVETDSIKWVCDHLYSYLNDTHVTTALLAELRELRRRMGV